jgi:hypothetical protein
MTDWGGAQDLSLTMALQPSERQFRRVVRGFYAWMAAFLTALIVPFFAQHLADSPDWAPRAGGVALGTLAWVPIFWVVVSIVRAGDEYHRRLHLAAAALAFCVSLLLLLPLSWLVIARFVEPPSLQLVWVGLALCWAVSLFVVKHRFERAS